jgi:NADH dehydrogenase (ubiquinone) 1 alpha subcomplex subunit 9
MVDREIFKQRRHINVPRALLKPIAGLCNRFLWWHTLSADEVEREFIDQEIDATAKTFKDLGIEPGDISKFTYHYLVGHFGDHTWSKFSLLTPLQQGFRSSAYYDLPPQTEREKREERKYLHVLDDQ